MLGVLLLAGFVYAVSQTIVFPAVGTLQREYDASASAVSWVLTAYLLSASVSTPIAGKLGDVHGKGRMLTAVLAVFALGSVVCALAQSIELVIAGRVVQGAGAGVFPLAFGIIRDTFPRERMAGALSLMSAMFGIGGGVGLPLSGLIIDHGDTSLIFWVGLLTAPAALAAYRMVPASPAAARRSIDVPGALLLSLGLVALLLGVTRANAWGWGSWKVVGLFVVGAVVLAVWVHVERRRAEPLIELRLLRRRAVAATNVTGFLIGFGLFSSLLLIPQVAQASGHGYGFGASVLESGLLLLPSSVLQLVGGPFAARCAARVGFRAVLVVGAALLLVAFLGFALAHDSPAEIVVWGLFLGGGLAFTLAAMANLMVGSVPQADVGIATGINTIMRAVGGAFGAAIATAAVAGHTIAGTDVPAEDGYTLAFLLAAGVGVLTLLAALCVPRPGRGASPRGTGGT